MFAAMVRQFHQPLAFFFFFFFFFSLSLFFLPFLFLKYFKRPKAEGEGSYKIP